MKDSLPCAPLLSSENAIFVLSSNSLTVRTGEIVFIIKLQPGSFTLPFDCLNLSFCHVCLCPRNGKQLSVSPLFFWKDSEKAN